MLLIESTKGDWVRKGCTGTRKVQGSETITLIFFVISGVSNAHKDRLKYPLIRKNGKLERSSWDEGMSPPSKVVLWTEYLSRDSILRQPSALIDLLTSL